MTEAGRGHLAMLGFAMLVSGSFSLGALAAPHIDPAALNAIRFVIAGTVLWAVAVATGKVDRAVFAAPWRYFVLAGLFAVYFVTMFEGLKTAEPVSMAAVFTLNPALTAVFGYFVVRQITTPRMALAIVVGGVGALWVIFDADLAALSRFEVGRGEAIYFWGCVAHALYAPMLRRLSRGESGVAFNAGILTAGSVILCIWAGPALIAMDWAALPAIVWWTILYVSLAATGVTFLILRYAALRLPSAKVMAYTYIVPSCVILWELALGRGVPTAMILPGVALTALSLLLLLKDEEKPVVLSKT
ncbi:DMT family transporter [Antarctobacter heliothermus]|uniref:EamA-like transporter family protein n=1 Tax=Antarctobacter heliothermus TaxID=74033 RepID=A0A239CCT3_9RHOB|nr:DMT family transporter [Antarctobacter heliothermus]SNS18027.1 EamA-like transporter family protein [Antarctobacter heliothermus]